MYYFNSCVSFEEGYKKTLRNILDNGRERNTRSFRTKELSPYVFTTSYPLRNILTNKIRNVSRAFMSAEFLWILSGRNDVEMVSFYNKNIVKFSDNGSSYRGAYGPMIQRQIEYIINTLKRDRSSRQAIIQIWNPNPFHSEDIPCTLSIQFLIDEMIDSLDVVVNMRSNDAWLGLPYDFYNFTMIQNYIAMKLGARIGRYTHQVGTEHLYEEHYEKAQQACSITDTLISDIESSTKFTIDQLSETMDIEQTIRNCQDNIKLFDFDKATIQLEQAWKEILYPIYLYVMKKTMKGNENGKNTNRHHRRNTGKN